MVSTLGLVACEVTIPGTRGGIVLAGTVELASVPGLMALEDVLSDSLWEA